MKVEATGVFDDWNEVHLVEDVGLEVDARSDLCEFKTVVAKVEDGALGDVEDFATGTAGLFCAEGDLLHLADQFADAAFLLDVEFAVFDVSA